MKKTFLLAIALLCFCAPMSLFAQKQLAFKDGKFKIVQFTDIHWDQKSPKCAKTVATIQSVLKAENPDVAMLTGDVVTASPGLEGWKSVIGIFEEAKIPFTVMMGNHDAEIVPKDEIYALLSQSPYFMGEKGPGDIHGAGNYVVPVYSSDGKKPAALLYCIDSNDYPTLKDYGTYDWIHFDQINWYREQSMRYTKENGGKPLPALAFFHIPLLEYNEIVGAETTLGQKEEGIASPKINTGFFASLVEMKDVMATLIRKHAALPADFQGVEFEKYIYCDNLYQGYLSTQKQELLNEMAGILYNAPGIKTNAAEKLSTFYWFASLKELFSRTFPSFLRPAGSMTSENLLEQGAPLGRRLQEAMNAQIRALTKGDITKEREVLSMDTWRALAELDAQAKEYEELKKQYGK